MIENSKSSHRLVWQWEERLAWRERSPPPPRSGVSRGGSTEQRSSWPAQYSLLCSTEWDRTSWQRVFWSSPSVRELSCRAAPWISTPVFLSLEPEAGSGRRPLRSSVFRLSLRSPCAHWDYSQRVCSRRQHCKFSLVFHSLRCRHLSPFSPFPSSLPLLQGGFGRF